MRQPGPARLVAYAPTPDPEASRVFYAKLGFAVHLDERDGTGERRLRLTHPRLPGALLHLRRGALSPPVPGELDETTPVMFAIVDADDFERWRDLVRAHQLPVACELSQPWGRWLFLRDPGGNLFSITSSDLF